MRDYSKVSSQFWTGETGRAIRGDMQAQIVALYLLTSPHANMIGVFQCPLIYIAHETGSPLEGASKGLQRLIEGGFCTYDEASETVWVYEMANLQIGDDLKPGDNRIKGIQKYFANMPEGFIKQGFYARYRDAFHLTEPAPKPGFKKPLGSPLEAPSKPLRSQEQEQEQKHVDDDETGTILARDEPPPVVVVAVPDFLESPPKPATSPPQTADPITLRAIELTALLRHRGAALQASHPKVREWAQSGLTDADALVALEKAQQQRAEKADPTPVNAGYLDAIIAAQKRVGSSKSRDSPALSPFAPGAYGAI